jgi:hypothetical protein
VSGSALISFEWADDEYRFRLAIGQLRELQDKTGVGPYALLNRIMGGAWKVDDLRETIRLGLIGGGMKPVEALSLVRRYVEERPFMESVAPAQAIVAAALMGVPDDPVGKRVPEETDASGSTSPSSSALEPPSGGQPVS